MMFESNFNGTWDQYIDAFAEVMPKRFNFFWGSSINFPGPLPTGPFRAWVRRHQYDVQFYESAEPEATATAVTSALGLETKLRRFARRSQRWNPRKFLRRYERFLGRVERDL
jgi:hypothetical protein